MSFTKELRAVRQAGEDLEWYPTTNEILERLSCSLTEGSVLDVGAGNGKVLHFLKDKGLDGPFYAIEQSQLHRGRYGTDIELMGCDFNQTSLIHKDVDAIFCTMGRPEDPLLIMKTTLKTAVTTKPYEVKAYGYTIIVPEGSRVSNHTAMGNDDNYRFWQDWRKTAEKLTGFKNSILAHDLNYRGINVPADYCTPY